MSPRVVVVTGAGRGIGRAIGEAFAAQGDLVASLTLGSEEELQEARLAMSAHHDAVIERGDAADPAAVNAFASMVAERLGDIDVWVNNVGRGLAKPLVEMTDDDWATVLDANVSSYFYGCRAALRQMIPRRRGRIINISSVTNIQPMTGLTAYAASKGAIASLTRALALECAPHGITVNAVAPGAVTTLLSAYTPDEQRRYSARIPLGHVATPADIAGSVVYLASNAAEYVTGQELRVDGGLTINGDIS
ncbi:SDR family NAD(P)-dependent oxidoreductase [Microbacterium sp.]|uniref:SDR family NAD(P)-dependent oxidoreductase n=1 Tax=Microbacterium sp. TaxID=51671 RepID=UPI003F9C354F